MLSNGIDTRNYGEDCSVGSSCNNDELCGYPTKEACLTSCLSRYGADLRCAEWNGPQICCCQFTHAIKAPRYPDNFCWYPTASSVTYVLNGTKPQTCPTVCGNILSTCNQAVPDQTLLTSPGSSQMDLASQPSPDSANFQLLPGGWCFPVTSTGLDGRAYGEQCMIGTACSAEAEGLCGFPNKELCFASCWARYGTSLRCAEFNGPTVCCCQYIHEVKVQTYPESFCRFSTFDSQTYVQNGTIPHICPNQCRDVHSVCHQKVAVSATITIRQAAYNVLIFSLYLSSASVLIGTGH